MLSRVSSHFSTFHLVAFRKCIYFDGRAREPSKKAYKVFAFLEWKSFYLDARGNMTVPPPHICPFGPS